MDTDAERLALIEQRHKATTAGPWRLVEVEETPRSGAAEVLPQPWTVYSDAPEFGTLIAVKPIRWMRADPADADFIAHSREDVPWLLEKLRSAEAELAAYREAGRLALLWLPTVGELTYRASEESKAQIRAIRAAFGSEGGA